MVLADAPARTPAAPPPAVPRYLPWIGLPWTHTRFQLEPLECMRRLHAKHGPLVVYDNPQPLRGRKIAVMYTSDPGFSRLVLNDTDHLRGPALARKGEPDSPQQATRFNLFRLHGQQHRDHRRVISPTLGAAEVEVHAPMIAERVAAGIAGWKAGERVDVSGDMLALAQDLSASLLFGRDDVAQTDEIRRLMNEWAGLNFRALAQLSSVSWPGTPRHRMLDLADQMHARVHDLMLRRRDEAQRGDDLISQLVSSLDRRGGLTESELTVHAHIMYFAGHVTTAATLTWTLFLLAQHPRVAHALREELRGQPGTPASLAGCDLLARVIDESMRLLPAVPYIMRRAVKDTVIGGVVAPRRSRVYVSSYCMHHDARHFPDPERFDPDRWIGMSSSMPAMVPFGAGQHVCVGRWFALLALKIALSTIVQRFTFRVAAGQRLDRSVRVTLSPKQPVLMDLEGPGGDFTRVPVRGDVHEMVDLA